MREVLAGFLVCVPQNNKKNKPRKKIRAFKFFVLKHFSIFLSLSFFFSRKILAQRGYGKDSKLKLKVDDY